MRTVGELHGYEIRATDGLIGKIDEIYFDDERWVVRYIVVDTGTWLKARRVLVSPIAFGEPDWHSRTIPTRLTKDRIEHSPSIDLDKPVSRQQEAQFNNYFGWPAYWGSFGLWGRWSAPVAMGMPLHPDPRADAAAAAADHHLRSSREVTRYRLHASDGEIGHITDFLIDDVSWEVRYLAVATTGWWTGKQVLIPTSLIETVRWDERRVDVHVRRELVKDSPEWNPDDPSWSDYEQRLRAYYADQRPPGRDSA
ncbi:MAG: PRC-barrel domain-containing protein [Deltaproteobacteria bacterium]